MSAIACARCSKQIFGHDPAALTVEGKLIHQTCAKLFQNAVKEQQHPCKKCNRRISFSDKLDVLNGDLIHEVCPQSPVAGGNTKTIQ